MTREWAAHHTLYFYIKSRCEVPVPTFISVIIYHLNIKDSITGQRLDQINGPLIIREQKKINKKRERERESKKAEKVGRGESHAMRLQS